jgi:hypothetical protein
MAGREGVNDPVNHPMLPKHGATSLPGFQQVMTFVTNW